MNTTKAITQATIIFRDTEKQIGDIRWDGNDDPNWSGEIYVAGTTDGTAALYGGTNGDPVMLAECSETDGWVLAEDCDGDSALLAELDNITLNDDAPDGIKAFLEGLVETAEEESSIL